MSKEVTDRELLKKVAQHFDSRLDEIERKLGFLESDVSGIRDIVEQLQALLIYVEEALPPRGDKDGGTTTT